MYSILNKWGLVLLLCRWDHNQEWDVAKFTGSGSGGPEYQVKVDLSTVDYSYLEGHTLDGRILFPATGYMVSQLALSVQLSLFMNYFNVR